MTARSVGCKFLQYSCAACATAPLLGPVSNPCVFASVCSIAKESSSEATKAFEVQPPPQQASTPNTERLGGAQPTTDYEKQLKKGDNIIMAAFGGGFTWGAVYVKWAYNAN